MTKVLCVLYDDPVDGYPPSYARDAVPAIERHHNGQTTPTPERIDFTPGELLNSVSGELGRAAFPRGTWTHLVVTSDKEGPDSALDRELSDADVVISQALLACLSDGPRGDSTSAPTTAPASFIDS